MIAYRASLDSRSRRLLFPLGVLALWLAVVLFGTLGHRWAWPGSQDGHGFWMFPINDCGNNNILLTVGPAFGWCTRGIIQDTKLDQLVESRHPGVFDLPFGSPEVEQAIQETREWLQGLWNVFEETQTIE